VLGGLESVSQYHRLVQPSAGWWVDRSLEIVDERMNLLVRLGPIRLAVLVLDVAVQRCDRGVDQLGRGMSS
jgi:hypothetical protein